MTMPSTNTDFANTKDPRAHDWVFQRPSSTPAQLVLLFHGYGSTPQAMEPLAIQVMQAFPGAWVISVAGHLRSALHAGFEWFSTAGIADDNRPARVAAAMPAFRSAVEHWQSESGMTAHATCLIGFSQGAIMALESTQDPQPGADLAGRIVALSGRFATLPWRKPPATTVHMIHGKQDAVMHYGLTVQAAEHWIAMGADVTADVIPFLGHAVNDEVVALTMERLTTYIPQRLWDEAQRANPE